MGEGGLGIDIAFDCVVPAKVRKLSNSHLAVHVTTPGERNWFMFRLTGIPPSGQVVRIDITGVDLRHWRSLNPVISYTDDLASLDAYRDASGGEYFNLPHGGTSPSESASGWSFVRDAWVDDERRFTFVHEYKRDAVIAMRVPYVPAYDDAFAAEIGSHLGVEVFEIGRSDGSRHKRGALRGHQYRYHELHGVGPLKLVG
jgi:hypothetical protein